MDNYDVGENRKAAGLHCTSLPYDISRIIVWDEQLDLHDVAALRITCRAFVEAANTRLFYRIVISKLNRDRDAFLTICKSPHLARHVREVEWLELSFDVNLFDRMAKPFEIADERSKHEAGALCRYFEAEAKAAFWMHNAPTGAPDFDGTEVEFARTTAVAQFQDEFMAALGRLPNLHSFISAPMNSGRIINSQDAEYPMTTSIFQRYQNKTIPPFPPQTNDGLFLFLLPAMDRPTSTITRLRWADEFPGYSYVRQPPLSAFERLESLELCLTPEVCGVRMADMSWIPQLEAACKRAVPTLRHLKLCTEHGYPMHSLRPDWEELLPETEKMLLGRGLAAAPGCVLQSLSLIGVWCGTDNLLAVIRANASTLHHLHLENAAVKTDVVRQMAKIPGLHLSTMRVVEDEIWDFHRREGRRRLPILYEPALLRYLGDVGLDEGGSEEGCFDTRGDLVDGCCRNKVRMLVETWSPSFFVTSSSPFVDDIDFESVTSSDRSEDSLDSMDHRLRTAPKWAWAHYLHKDSPSIYCYRVSDSDSEGHVTEYWKFTSRNGEVAYGKDPLDFFDDWDVDAGDMEEPTPFCDALDSFANCGPLEGSQDWNNIKDMEPPEDAMKYDPHDDPSVPYRREEYVPPSSKTSKPASLM